MREQILRKIGDNISLQTVFDPSSIYQQNYQEKIAGNNGWTPEKSMKKLIEYPVDDLEMLITAGDLDAFALKHATTKEVVAESLRNIKRKYPDLYRSWGGS
jgi:hypothetical protein